MKKAFLLLGMITLFSCFPMFRSVFQQEAKAEDKPEPSLYLTGKNIYQRNGLISFTSQESAVVEVEGRDLEESEITIDVYDADMQDVLRFLTYDDEDKQINSEVSLEGRDEIATFVTKWKDSFELPFGDKNGVLLIHAKAGELEIYSFAIRSNVGAVVTEVQDELLIWSQNFDTKRKENNQNVVFYSLKNNVLKQKSVTTNSEGIATTPISSQYDIAIVGDGDDLAFVPIGMRQLGYGGNYSFANQSPNSKFFIFTDRSLYKPGDKIYFKSILRDDNDVNFVIPSGNWRAKIVYGWGDSEEIIREQNFTVNEYGTFDGEFKLPENVNTGEYRFVVEKIDEEQKSSDYWWDEGYGEVYFQVEHYRKPEYTLDMEVDQTQLINGKNITFNIEGEYFSGQPLNGVEVEYTVRESDFYNSTFYYPQQIDNFNYRRYYGKEIEKGKAVLDADGSAQVSVNTDIKDGENKIYSIELSYASEAGGENVREQKNVLVFAGEYNIYRESHKYSFHVDEEIKLDLILKENKEKADLAGKKLTVAPKRIWWEKELVDDLRDKSRYNYKRKEEILENFEIITDSQDRAVLRFNPQKSGSYEFKVKSMDSQDNSIEKTFSVWVSDKYYSYSGQGSKELNVILDKNSYEPGENVTASISSEMPDRDILFSVGRNFIHEYKVVSMNGNSVNVDFQVSDDYMPSAKVEAVSFSSDKINTSSTSLQVSAQKKRLDISIETDKDIYSAGEEVKATVKVTDQNGEPQKSEVALWAVDKALFELSDPSGQKSFDSFWNYRYGNVSFTHSLRGLSINAAEKGGCFKAGSQILMSDSSTKNIEEVKVGDFVLTRENENSENLVKEKVIKTHNVEVDGYFVINNNLNVTENHVVRVNDEWRRADQIKIGNYLIDRDGKNVTVESIEWRKEKTMVYNLEIEDKHSYFVNGVWVHNGKSGGAGRSVFKDVAYWNPKIVTDKNGEAEVSFKLSDDLTTWAFSAVGVTKDTKVGNANHEIKVSQPVILRPYLPNIFYTEDEVNVSVEAQNFSGKKRNFQAKIEFDGGEVKNNLQEIEIEDGETKEIIFTIYPKEEKDAQLTFSLNSKDEESVGDKITKKVSIEKFGFLEKSSSVHKANENINLQINEDAFNDKTEVNLEVSATLLGSLPSAIDYLIDYPYGCIEQTTSRFRAVLAVKQNPEIFYKANQEKDIDAILNEGIKRLSKMQNSDGGWSWWSSKKSSPFISIYVAESLLEAKEVGVEVDEEMINSAEKYFSEYYYSEFKRLESDVDKKERLIVVRYGNSLFGKNNGMVQLYSNLDPDMIALGVMANIRNGFTNPNENGLNILKNKLQQEGNYKYWLSADYNRFGSADASTALGLRAFLMADVEKDEIDSIVKYLTNSRKRQYWNSTFATSKVIGALMDYADKHEYNLKVNKNIQIYNDGENILNETLSLKNHSVNIPVSVNDIKKEGSNLKVQSNDDVYITLIKKEFRTDRNAQVVSNGISIERNYINKNETGEIGKGDIVDVEVKVSGLNKDNAYLVVEDKLPAGLIPVNENLKNVSSESDAYINYDYAQREYTKNGVILHRENINSGSLIFNYKAKAIASGVFIDPPTVAEMMYNPDIYARTGVQTLEISLESQKESLEDFNAEMKSWFKKIFGYSREILVIFVSFVVITYGIIVLVRDKFKV